MAFAQTLGKYEIRRTLGRGAMGVVYEAFDPDIQRIVAIKTVRLPAAGDGETADDLARFRREAQAAGRLTHPNIVGVFDYGTTGDLAYIVMEFVDGPTLKSLMDARERFPLSRIVSIMNDLLAGLRFSHERGVVHRDIKPANVMLTAAGQAKIADFGIARIENATITQAGTVIGTPAFMSPEQFMGEAVDARSDIWSAGVLLYQLLTGERPFDGSMSAIMHKALNTEPPLPSQISVAAPLAFDAVVRRALAKRPEDRFPSARAFAAAIQAAAAAPGEPAGADAEPTMVSPPARAALAAAAAPEEEILPRAKSRLIQLAIAAGVAAVMAGLYFALSGRRAMVAETPAEAVAQSSAGPGPVVSLAAPASPRAGDSPVQTEMTPLPVDPSATVRAMFASFAGGLRCSLVDGDIRDGVVQIAGLGGKDAIEAIERILAGLGPAGTAPWRQITQIDPALCDWADLLRPAAAAFGDPGGRLGLRLAGDPVWLQKNDYIRPRLTMAEFRGVLRVDYIDRSGNVLHLYPQVADVKQGIAADPARLLAPNEPIVLGEPGPAHRGWQVDEPFGTDLIVAIASEEPLFDKPRPGNIESAAVYRRDLRAALDKARARGQRLAVAALPVETRLK